MSTQKTALIVVSEDWYFLSHRLPLARSLQKKGYQVHVACRLNKHRGNLEKEGFLVHDINIGRGSLSPVSAIKSIWTLKTIYKSLNPDIIIHVALLISFLGTIAALQSKTKSVMNMITGLGFIFIATSTKAKFIRTVVSQCFSYFSRYKKIHMVVQNEDDFALMTKLGFKADETLSIIRGSGVNAEEFHPPIDITVNQNITFVGRLLWAKGIGELVEAARILKARGKSYSFHVVGDPDEGNPQSASKIEVDQWKNEKLINFLGRRKDIAQIYRQSTLAVLPSWREGLPKSLLEAAASGLPMIATDVPGCREIVKDGENGLLVPLKDATALANAIETLMDSPELRQKFGKKSRHFVNNELNEQSITEKTQKLIDRLIHT